jgi:hypothetical protein
MSSNTHPLSTVVTNTPIEYINEYHLIADTFTNTTASDGYLPIRNKLDALRGRVVDDLSKLDDYENNRGQIYTKLKSDTNVLYSSNYVRIFITGIGIVILFFLIYITKPTLAPVEVIVSK